MGQIPHPGSRAEIKAFIDSIRKAPNESSSSDIFNSARGFMVQNSAQYHWDPHIRLAYMEAFGSQPGSRESVFIGIANDPVQWLRKAAINHLTASIETGDSDGRSRDCRLLLHFGDQEVNVLIDAMQSEDEQLASIAMRTLATINSQSLGPLLFDAAVKEIYSGKPGRSEYDSKWQAAMAVLRSSMDPRLTDFIFGLLHNESVNLQLAACSLAAQARKSDARIVERLKSMAWSEDRRVSLAAANSLVRFNDKDAIEIAFEVLRAQPDQINSTQWIRFIGFEIPDVESLMFETWDAYPYTRSTLRAPMRILGTHGAIARLLDAAIEPNGTYSFGVIVQLAQADSPDAIRLVQDYLHRLPSSEVQNVLLSIRREIGDEKFVKNLILNVDDTTRELVIEKTAGQLAYNQFFLQECSMLAHSESGSVRYFTVRTLAQSQDKSAVVSLMHFLDDESSLVWEMAFDALLTHGEKRTYLFLNDVTSKSEIVSLCKSKAHVPAYLRQFSGESLDPERLNELVASNLAIDRRDVAVACILLPKDVASQLILILLSDQEESVRKLAFSAATQVGGEQLDDWFNQLADSSDWNDRSFAAQYFGRTRGQQAIPVLVRLLGDPVYGVRYSAARYLAMFAEPEADRALAKLMDADELRLASFAAIGLARVASAEEWKVIMNADEYIIRHDAISGLQKRHIERVANTLWTYAQTESAPIHWLIVRRLAEIEHPEAVQRLIDGSKYFESPFWYENLRALILCPSTDAMSASIEVLKVVSPAYALYMIQLIGENLNQDWLNKAAEIVKVRFPQHFQALTQSAARRGIEIR